MDSPIVVLENSSGVVSSGVVSICSTKVGTLPSCVVSATSNPEFGNSTVASLLKFGGILYQKWVILWNMHNYIKKQKDVWIFNKNVSHRTCQKYVS